MEDEDEIVCDIKIQGDPKPNVKRIVGTIKPLVNEKRLSLECVARKPADSYFNVNETMVWRRKR